MNKKFTYFLKELILLCVGGLVYVNIELIARGFSHWSMFIVGGICFVIIGLINELYQWDMVFQKQCLLGAWMITSLEFGTGIIINKLLDWNVWDYSNKSFNLMGQICLHHSILYWIPLSAVAIVVDDFIRYWLFHEKKPEYHFKNLDSTK